MHALTSEAGGASVSVLVTSDSERIFKEMDTNCDGEMSFEEFVAWQREALFHSGISQEEAVGCIQKLATLLEAVFLFYTPGRQDKLDAFKNPVMQPILDKLSNCARELWKKKRNSNMKTQTSPVSLEVWQQVPEALSTTSLLRKNLQEPISTKGVSKMNVRVYSCIPAPPREECETMAMTTEQHRWLAKVIRDVTYNNGAAKSIPYHYVFEGNTWKCSSDGKLFDEALTRLSPEMRLYALLLSETDFGRHTLQWAQVETCLKDAINMGIISVEDFLEYRMSLEKFVVRAAADSDEAMQKRASSHQARKALAAELLPQVILSPQQIMAGLCGLDILPEQTLWEDVPTLRVAGN